MPIWTATLEDGTEVDLDSEKEPTHDEILRALSNYKEPEPAPKMDVGALLKAPVRGEAMGPLGPVDPAEGARVFRDIPAAISTAGQQLTQPIADMAADLLRRTIDASAEPDKPLIDFSAKAEKKPGPDETSAEAAARKLLDTVSGFTTPRQIAMLPFLPFKAVQGIFGAEAAAGVPQSIEEIGRARTPSETGAALTGAGANLALSGLLGHSILGDTGTAIPKPEIPITTEGAPDAQTIRSDTGQPEIGGPLGEGIQADRGGDLQQAPPGTPNAPAPQTQVSSEAPERLESAAWVPDPIYYEDSEVVKGPNHPAILKQLGIKGFETPESRNTDQFGFWTNKGRFVTRDVAGEIAKASGQDLKEFETGEMVHSNEVSATPGGTTPISETKQPVQPALKGMGGATTEEFEQPGTYVSNMFAAIDRDRAELGKPPMERKPGRSWDEDNQRALAQMNRDPQWIPRLIEDMLNDPRPLLSWENAGMVWHRAKLKAEANNAYRRINQAFEDGREADLSQARTDARRFEDEIVQMDEAVGRGGTGSEAGRSLQAQKMGAGPDFTLVEMRMQARADRGGRRLTPEEENEIKDLHDQIAAKEAEGARLLAEKDSKLAEAHLKLATAEILRQKAESKVPTRAVLKVAEKIVKGLDTAADAARERIRQRGTRFSAGLDPTVLLDVAEIGAAHIAHIGLDFAKWSARMVEEFSEGIKPYLDQIYEASQKKLDDFAEKVTPRATEERRSAVKRAVTKQTPQEQRGGWAKKVKQRVQEGKNDQVFWYAQRLARSFAAEGITDRDELVDAVHDTLKQELPDLTRRETMDMVSGYGRYKPPPSDAISMALQQIKGQLQQVAKLMDMAEGKAPKRSGLGRPKPGDEWRRLIQQVEDAKRRGGYAVTDEATQLRTAMQSATTRLDNQIKDLEHEIETKTPIVKQKTQRPDAPEIQALKKKRDELKEIRDTLFGETEVKRALERYQKSLLKRQADYTDRMARKDFAPKERQQLPLDPKTQQIKVDTERIKQKWEEMRATERAKNRTTGERIRDIVARWTREFILSSPVSALKLLAAAMWGLVTEPIKEGVGAVIAKALPGFAERLETQAPSSLAIEAKAHTTAFMRIGKQFVKTLKTGKSDIEVQWGGWRAIPEEMKAWFGTLHSAIKTPLKEVVFAREHERLVQLYLRRGLDPEEPLNMLRIGNLAYREMNRRLFMEDNRVVSTYKTALASFERVKPGQKPTISQLVVGTAARKFIPIVKIPTNLVAQTFNAALGGIVGGTRLAYHYAKGIEKLPPEAADSIMRQLKAGSIGGAIFALGYFYADMAGGYYEPGARKKKGDVGFGKLRIPGVSLPSWLGGPDIPTFLLHNPLIETFQLGATVRKVADSKLRKKDLGTQGLGAGAMAGALGLVDDVPFVKEMWDTHKLWDPQTRTEWLRVQAASALEPQAMQWLARVLDKDAKGEVVSRKATTTWEQIELGIPYLRQNVPRKPVK